MAPNKAQRAAPHPLAHQRGVLPTAPAPASPGRCTPKPPARGSATAAAAAAVSATERFILSGRSVLALCTLAHSLGLGSRDVVFIQRMSPSTPPLNVEIFCDATHELGTKPHQHGSRGVQARRGPGLRPAQQRGCSRDGHGLLEVSRGQASGRTDARPGAAPIPALRARGTSGRAPHARQRCSADAPMCSAAPCCLETRRPMRRSRQMRCATPSRSIRKTLRCSRAWPSASSPRQQRARVPCLRYDCQSAQTQNR
jgi:hypothetical protein